MDNRRLTAVALVVVGMVAVNFFYLSDLIIRPDPGSDIIIGWKSAVAIGIGNLIALAGVWQVARGNPGD
jgi:hypothetical protein